MGYPTPITSTPAGSGRRIYFINGLTDFLAIGGLSILAFIAVRIWGVSDGGPEFFAVAVLLQWVSNYPHFAASTTRLYESADHVRQYPLTALVVPWLILAGVIASFLSPEGVAPYFVKLFWIWSPYHYSGQTLGISLIYAHRQGYFIGRPERFALSTFIYGTFISQTIRSEIGPGQVKYFGIPFPSFALPDWRLPGREAYLVADVADFVMYAGAAVFLAFVLYRWMTERQRPPHILFVPAVAQYVWFVESPWWQSFREFVPFFHSLQYLFIAWAVRLKGRMDRGEATPSRRAVFWESLDWLLLILQGGVVLFALLPLVGEWLSGRSLLVSMAIITAGVQIHHFFVDGVIWKLRTKRVKSPLMVNLDDLVGSSPVTKP